MASVTTSPYSLAMASMATRGNLSTPGRKRENDRVEPRKGSAGGPWFRNHVLLNDWTRAENAKYLVGRLARVPSGCPWPP